MDILTSHDACMLQVCVSMPCAHLHSHVCVAACCWLWPGAWECVRLVFTEQSESVKSSELSRSTSIKDQSQSGLTRSCHRHMVPVPQPKPPSSSSSTSSYSISLIPLSLSPSLRPRKHCFCQKPAALSTGGGMSLSLSLTVTYTLAYSLVCSSTNTCTHNTQTQSHIFSTLRLRPVSSILIGLSPSLCDLYLPTPPPSPAWAAHRVVHGLIVSDSWV